MIINGNSLDLYKGMLVSLNIGTAARTVTKGFLTKKQMCPLKTADMEYQEVPIKLAVEINADSAEEFEILKGELTSSLCECDIIFSDMPDRVYQSWLAAEPEILKDLPEIGTVTYSLNAVCIGKKIVRQFSDTLEFTYEGNAKTPAVIEIVTQTGLNSITITGISDKSVTVRNIIKDIPLVIDGENVLITQNGVNKFGDSDLWEFPSLKPGNNIITLSTACAATLTYKPRYI